MTIQNWSLEPARAAIVCDSLATHGDTDEPHAFISKAWCVPHQSIMLAVKDWAYPTMMLYSQIALGQAPPTLPELIAYASDELRAAASQGSHYLTELPFTRTALFAWDEHANEIVGWIFRADRNFVGEQMPAGLLLTPDIPVGYGEPDWCMLALRQQASDRALDQADRDNIGGWLMSYEMTTNVDGTPPTTTIRNLGKLPHFDADAAHIHWLRSEAMAAQANRAA